MPAGDPQRTWFPEMVVIIRARWHVRLSLAELVQLLDELDTTLHHIRAELYRRPPVITCPCLWTFGIAAESNSYRPGH
jgi:hypothetical protein